MRAIAGIPALILLCSSAFADCEVRYGTAAEIEHKARVQKTLADALPAAPPKWTLTVREDKSKPSTCASQIGAFEIVLLASYTYKPTKEESEQLNAESRRLRKQIDDLRELPPEVKKERQVWLDKMSEANRASNAAYKAGDKVLARAKSDEADAYSAKGRAIRDRYWAGVQPKVAELEARANTLRPSGNTVNVRMIANEQSAGSKPAAHMGMQFTAGKVPAPNPGLKVQGVRLIVEGTAEERRAIEAAVDREKLKRVVR
jgi:hypothetical protein